MKNTRICLVTGGCGFIGSNFVRLIHENFPHWRVVNLDKLTYAGNLKNLDGIEEGERYRFVRGDVCNDELLSLLFREERIDTVVHFAAESHVDKSILGPGEFIRTNVVGTHTLLEVARQVWLNEGGLTDRNCFLHVSTDEVYGSLGETGLFTEQTPYDPRSPYSSSKAASDHIASAYYHTYGLPVRITNCSNNYGPYQFPEKLIPLIFNNAMKGEPLPVYGDGRNVRDWLFVKDHCEAIVEVIEKGVDGECYNIGGNNEKRNIEVVETICDLLDAKCGLLPGGKARRQCITFVKDRLGHDRRYAIDAGKIRRQLGWKPAMTFERGIELTVDWYLANMDWVEEIVSGEYQDYYRRMYGTAGEGKK